MILRNKALEDYMQKKMVMLSWDWRDQQPDWRQINKVLPEFESPIFVPVIDTGCDSYAVMVAERPFGEEDAQEAYDRWDDQ